MDFRRFAARSWLLLLALSVPLMALAQTPGRVEPGFFGPIIPQAGVCRCPESAPDWGCLLEVFQNTLNVAVSLAVVWCTLLIAFAGFSYMMSPAKVGNIQLAKQRLWGAVIGLTVVLSAWLIVDFVMKALYDPDASFAGQNLGPWNNILSGGEANFCIRPNLDTFGITGSLDILRPSSGSGGVAGGQGGVSGLPAGTPAGVDGPGTCSWANVRAASIQSGAPVSEGTARYLACIARPESSCGTRMENYNWGKGSSAYGHFQVLIDTHPECFSNQVCAAAAGVSGPLNCGPAFRGGNIVPAQRELANRCTRAAANLACSVQAAQCVLRKQGPGAWSANDDSKPAHRACEAYLRQS